MDFIPSINPNTGRPCMRPVPKYEGCCCFQCGLLVGPESNPDCACDMGPIYEKDACSACPKKGFCEVPEKPELYSDPTAREESK